MSGRSDGLALRHDGVWIDEADLIPRTMPGEDSAVAHGEVLTPQPDVPAPGAYPNVPPARVSSDPNHRDFHPSARRIAVQVDGVPMGNVHWYDAERGLFQIVDDGRNGRFHEGQVTVYWRGQETRQERRARERWDAKHGHR